MIFMLLLLLHPTCESVNLSERERGSYSPRPVGGMQHSMADVASPTAARRDEYLEDIYKPRFPQFAQTTVLFDSFFSLQICMLSSLP